MAVMVASFASKKTVYGLEDKLRFGKYSGFTLEELIRSDSKYVWWLVNVSDTFDVDQFAFELLMELDPPKRGHSL